MEGVPKGSLHEKAKGGIVLGRGGSGRDLDLAVTQNRVITNAGEKKKET